MNFFSVCQVFTASNLDRDNGISYEENWIIIDASDLMDATNKALANGKGQEETFLNIHGEKIHWAFAGLKDIREVNTESNIATICTVSAAKNVEPVLQIRASAFKSYA